jgi:hypothetical protein
MRNFKVLAYCEFSKFTWDQSDWSGKVEYGNTGKGKENQLKILWRTREVFRLSWKYDACCWCHFLLSHGSKLNYRIERDCLSFYGWDTVVYKLSLSLSHSHTHTHTHTRTGFYQFWLFYQVPDNIIVIQKGWCAVQTLVAKVLRSTFIISARYYKWTLFKILRTIYCT